MSVTGGQVKLRDDICAMVLDRLDEAQINPSLIEAAIACMGAAAVCLGALGPAAREEAAKSICENLLKTANKRAEEIGSGAFDRLHGGPL